MTSTGIENFWRSFRILLGIVIALSTVTIFVTGGIYKGLSFIAGAATGVLSVWMLGYSVALIADAGLQKKAGASNGFSKFWRGLVTMTRLAVLGTLIGFAILSDATDPVIYISGFIAVQALLIAAAILYSKKN